MPPHRYQTPSPDHPETSLPARVAGIVFWGLVLLGLTGVFLFQRDLDHRYTYDVEMRTLRFGQLLDELLQQSGRPDLRTSRSDIEVLFASMGEAYRLKGARLRLGSQRLEIGRPEAGDTVVRKRFHLGGSSGARYLDLEAHYPPKAKVLAAARRDLLVVLGLVVMLFALLLKLILDRMLARPFRDMVRTAAAIGDGDMRRRFDERRGDEFGFLAHFINRMLDQLFEQRMALESYAGRLAEEKERAEVTLNAIADGVITVDTRCCITYLNPVAEQLTGWRLDRARGLELDAVVHLMDEDNGLPLENPVIPALRTGRSSRLAGNAVLVRETGDLHAVEAVAAVMRGPQGRPMGAVLVLQDVSENRALTRELAHQARHDALTGLHNRISFEERLSELLEAGRDKVHALLYMDLDQFKVVNDTCGHLAGDQLLRQLADEMRRCLGTHDLLARLGGDEFGVLLHDCDARRARAVAENLRRIVTGHAFLWEGRSLRVGISIGLVIIHPEEHRDVIELLRAADLACYTAKDTGRNRIHVYEPADMELARRHGEMRWVSRINAAIDEDRLSLFRQPVVSLQEKSGIHHCEILVRMRDREGRLARPDQFLRAAERYNLMGRVDRWVIAHAFACLARADLWAQEEMGRRRMAINLSGSSLGDADLLEFIVEQQRCHGISFDEICFEITETEAIGNLARATEFIQRMRALGVHFALDDFGSGLSSFAYLKNLPVDYLKIDGGFVVGMTKDPVDRAMVSSITEIGHLMGLSVIAEWVEDEETLGLLRELGVDYAQGFHVGRPAPLDPPCAGRRLMQ